MANIYKYLHISLRLLAALLLSAINALAMPIAPTASHQVDFLPHQQDVIVENGNIHFAARAPPFVTTNIAFAGAAVAQYGNGIVMYGHEAHVASLGFGADLYATNNVPLKPLVDPSTNVASAQRTQHILHGDATGGGHLWPGGAGKTPFPQDWDANRIMSTTSVLATNPNLLWKPQTGNGGLYTKSGKPARFVVTDANGNLPVVDGVPVRVIIEPAGEGIITAYPKY
jgi:hypothetical protein